MTVTYRPNNEAYTHEEVMENRKEWVKALRSGNYGQGTGYLNNADMFCCLGVACEVLGVKGEVSEYSQSRKVYQGNEAYPPQSVLRALGYDPEQEDGLLPSGELLATLNDSDLLTFDQIAGTIEAQPSIYDERTKSYVLASPSS